MNCPVVVILSKHLVVTQDSYYIRSLQFPISPFKTKRISLTYLTCNTIKALESRNHPVKTSKSSQNLKILGVGEDQLQFNFKTQTKQQKQGMLFTNLLNNILQLYFQASQFVALFQIFMTTENDTPNAFQKMATEESLNVLPFLKPQSAIQCS